METKRNEPEISVAILILAAGRSSRMSPAAGHKLLARFDGVPFVRRTALRAIASRARHVYAVTGFRHDEIVNCLAGLDLTVAINPAYASGMASSLVAGLKIPDVMSHDGVLILLADMPAITADNLDTLIEAFKACRGQRIIRASHAGAPGNPVILPKRLYPQALMLQGDRGAKALIENSALEIVEIDIGEAALLDVDTVDDLLDLGGLAAGFSEKP